MCDGMVNKMGKAFQRRTENVYDELWVGDCVINNDLMLAVDKKICENRLFKILLLSYGFPKIQELTQIVVVHQVSEVMLMLGAKYIDWYAQNQTI